MEGTVNVVCGHKRGRFILSSCNIEFEDGGLLREVTPPAFEKLSGRACAKKWKESIRIENSDGSQGYTIGRWLQEAGITVPSSRQAHGGGAAGYTGSSAHAAATQVKLTMQEVDDHIQQIGLSMCDPTAAAEAGQDKAAVTKPPQLAAGGQDREAEGGVGERSEVNVGVLPMHELSYMAEATMPRNGGSEAAPRECGVLHSMVAVLSGRPPSLHTRAQGKARRELDTAMASYLEGQVDCYPHEMVGEGPPPMLDGRELDLRHLHRIVQDRGGHRAVRKMDRGAKHELWAAAASALGCPPDKHLGAAELVGQLYSNMLRRAAEASAKETAAALPACSGG